MHTHHYCYALHDGRGGTYVGYTVDPAHRLRQHNREIRGGARRTAVSAGRWKFLFIIAHEDAAIFNSHTALSLEWHLKRVVRGGRGGRGGRNKRRLRDGPRTSGTTGGVARRVHCLAEALCLHKFSRVIPRLVVLVDHAHVDCVWARLHESLPPSCCVLPL